MGALKYDKATPLRLKTSEFDEKWLQQRIEDDPSILGLGELRVLQRERRQSSGGRIDFLMKNDDDDTLKKDQKIEVQDVLGDRRTHVENFLNIFEKLNTDQTELVATVFAAWNDLIIKKTSPTEKAVSIEVLERWHPSKKKKFDAIKVTNCMKWMAGKGIVPDGSGKVTKTKRDDDEIGF